jgi:dephospho-CoA kinase
MITLGVTGGLGSGKSTVCRMLADMGAPVFVADDEAKRLMSDDPRLRQALTQAFGAETYNGDGSLNRGHLASIVFADSDSLSRINSIVHPFVFEAFEQFRDLAREDGAEIAVKEAAILFESGGDKHVDRTLLVDAPIQTRVERVSARDGMTRHEAMERMRHQMPSEELRSRADLIIDNDGSEEELREEVERVHAKLLRLANDERRL